MRVDSYKGLTEHLQQTANNVNGQVGKIVILPSTFIGSPRYMVQSYQDAMAIVQKFGKPHYFVTMTSNPNWREIQESLLPGQTASDRPDVVARAFDVKRKELLKEIVKNKALGWFGRVSKERITPRTLYFYSR